MQHLLDRNRTHFGQSKNCTFTSEPLDFTMECTATSPQANAILSGHYLKDEDCPTPHQLFSHPRHTEHTAPNDINNETLTLDLPCHVPLHLQRAALPELVHQFIDH